MKNLSVQWQIRRPNSNQELAYCVDMYLAQNDYSFLPADREHSLKSIMIQSRSGAFIRVLTVNGIIEAWILANVFDHKHMRMKVLQQEYYTSSTNGIKAVRYLQLMHNTLIEEAEIRGIPLVMSQCSHMDTQFQLSRILNKVGWESRGYVAIYKTKWFAPSEDRVAKKG